MASSSQPGFDSYGSEPIQAIHRQLQDMKKSLRTLRILVFVLVLALLALLIAFSVGLAASRNDIDGLQHKLSTSTSSSNVSLATKPGPRNGQIYGGSLFRGSGFWAPRVALPGALADHASVAVGDYIYIIGGINASATVQSAVWKYDPLFHNYTRVADMPTPRYRFSAAAINDLIYVATGRDKSDSLNSSDPLSDLLIFNPKSNVWTRGANASLGRSDACAAAVNGKLYVVGGYNATYGYLNLAEEYDPATNAWRRVADMPTPRGDLMCAALLGEVYALGGYYDTANRGNSFRQEMESFNPTTNSWTARPPLLTPRGDAALMVLPGNRLMLVGGEGHYLENANYKYPKHVNEVYYAADTVWVQKAMIPTARFRTAGAVSGGLAFMFGGASQCTNLPDCPVLPNVEIFLDVDHPHVYLYLDASNAIREGGYNDSAPDTIYPV